MQYLDIEKIESFDIAAFRNTKPYPWGNPQGLLTDEAFEVLRENLPGVERFNEEFGVKRSHGQAPHSRLTLKYSEDLDLPAPWHEFVTELRGMPYRRFLKRAFNRGLLALTFHWHYTPVSCSVSPHCDALRKLGSHIFYLNAEDDWREEWGGQTLVLDDNGRFDRKTAPDFQEFDSIQTSQVLGNRSFLFARNQKSWHGVREITCPEGAYRKVFIVVIEDKKRSLLHTVMDPFKGRKRARF